ncbi:MAG: tRNA pseudouridine(55) synthase TruB [Chitinispirillales bacterium]|jgi:tRNA pseudouridine55 synthase|nr:tRNA pseudouridine(55) synthase TruB [Chitinispirillales bacterium]
MNLDGFICVDKPVGPSSFSAVRAVCKALGVSKGGHAGTLDPMASGLLVVALGRCTRLLEYLSLEPKEYEFTVAFGASTDTFDAAGRVTARSGVIPTRGRLIEAMKGFSGETEQVPPQYSAVKTGGVPAYRMAREGVPVDIKPRTVRVYSLEMRGYDVDGRCADFAVSCSGGTYVRTLAVDITKAANVEAEGHISRLRRTRAGRFDLSNAVDFGDISNAKNYFINASDAFAQDKITVISDEQKVNVSMGRGIVIDGFDFAHPLTESGGDVLVAFDATGTLAAVLKRADGALYHPDKVFI